MKKEPLNRLAVLVATTLIVGCASTGNSPEKPLAERIKPGMTREQVIAVAGRPQNRQSGLTGGQNDELWLYSDGALNLIPVYGIVRGGRTNTINVSFKNGRVVTVGEGSFGLW